MKDYFNLWLQFFKGILALLWAILFPIIWLILEILPYGVSCLIFQDRLKKGYRYFYFLPKFVKDITRPFRMRKYKTSKG